MSGQTANSKSANTKAIEKEMEKLHRQDFWLRIQRTKLLMDLIFVCTSLASPSRLTSFLLYTYDLTAYEVFKLKPAKDVVKPFAGLTAALLRFAFLSV